MKEFKKPDLNAPRFRPKKKTILNSAFHKRFIAKNPKFKDITLEQLKSVITSYNGKIWETIIETRDGVELPEQLGYMFIGSTTKKKGGATDYKKSAELGYKVNHQNWESDQHLAKIFYTNHESKYKFTFYELWGFSGVRDFTRSVAKNYPSQWNKYIVVDQKLKISKLYRKEVYKDIVRKETTLKLETYDEFDFS